MASNKIEPMQQDGREKRTATLLCVTSMTGLLVKCFLQSSLTVASLCSGFLQKDLFGGR